MVLMEHEERRLGSSTQLATPMQDKPLPASALSSQLVPYLYGGFSLCVCFSVCLVAWGFFLGGGTIMYFCTRAAKRRVHG